MIDGIGLLPYSERLTTLGLTTLGERRCRGDLIETYKIVNGLVNYGQNLFNVSRSGYRLLSSLKSPKSNRQNFLPERVIRYWNKLPQSVQSASSVNSFKASPC